MSKIEFKQTPEQLVATVHLIIENRQQLFSVLERMAHLFAAQIIGPPFATFYGGSGILGGFNVEVGYPVNEPVHIPEITTYRLKSEKVLASHYSGALEKIDIRMHELIQTAERLNLPLTLYQREIYFQLNPFNADQSLIEVQAILHDWHGLLEQQVSECLSNEVCAQISLANTAQLISLEPVNRAKWVNQSISVLEQTVDQPTLCKILSGCAHEFPKDRIMALRTLFQQTGSVDAVLDAMYDDPGWYANPVRNRRVIIIKKMPFDIKGYAQAKTREEKMRSYCQCPLIRDHLDEVNPLFCSCGAGWFRQLWEGVLGRSVIVEMVKTVAKGDDCCLVNVKI